jgi:hypothetical protein
MCTVDEKVVSRDMSALRLARAKKMKNEDGEITDCLIQQTRPTEAKVGSHGGGTFVRAKPS